MDIDPNKLLELAEKIENGIASEDEEKEFYKNLDAFTKDVKDSVAQDVARAKLETLYNNI